VAGRAVDHPEPLVNFERLYDGLVRVKGDWNQVAVTESDCDMSASMGDTDPCQSTESIQ